MMEKPETQSAGHLPDNMPVFPLHGVLLLPGGQLPLNIFEPQYLRMFDDALRTNRLIGMAQPRKPDEHDLYNIGCAGRIIEFVETNDGRYEVVLKGISRFRIKEEIAAVGGYRRIRPDWQEFEKDLQNEQGCLGLDREHLKTLLMRYFEKQGMNCDWEAVDKVADGKLMTCLSMICPFKPVEKQALLEEKCCKERSRIFIAMLEMELYK
jgi:Lon protease-like protein